jgi:hypothetical protein
MPFMWFASEGAIATRKAKRPGVNQGKGRGITKPAVKKRRKR